MNKILFELDSIDITPFSNEEYEGVEIKWDSNQGFGTYTLYRVKGSSNWIADSEHMDSNENKNFLRKLLQKFADEVEVIE